MADVYIYSLVDPRTKQVRYIGQTNNPQRRLKQHIAGRSDQKITPVKSWIKSLLKNDLVPKMEIVEKCNSDNWQEREKHHIQKARNEIENLLNIADGGNMPKCTTETQSNNGTKSYTNQEKGIAYILRAMRNGIESGNKEKADYYRYVMASIKTADKAARKRLNEYGLRLLGYDH